MKKITFLLAALLMGLGIYAQSENDSDPFKQNEVKLNLPMTIFGSYPEISYERILNTGLSVGASLGVGLDKSVYSMQFSFVPYVRWFFGGNRKSMERAASGFFIEANGGLFSNYRDPKKFSSDNHTINTSAFGAGLGFGIGWKYLTKNNWVGEINWGIGRNFLKDKIGNEIYPHAGISIGKRF